MVGGMHGRGALVAEEHVWQGVCMVGGMCGRGHAWQGGMCGRGHAWQGASLEVGHVWRGGMHDRRACMPGGRCVWQIL